MLTGLQMSSQTKKPVRVIRGYKLHSEYAPVEGYRYDGLYTVEKVSSFPYTRTGLRLTDRLSRLGKNPV